jgi:signal transduction histidine kinase
MHREPACSVETTLDGQKIVKGMQLVIQGDGTLLYGMAANLLKNAVEASGGQPIRVDLTSGDPCVLRISNKLPVPEEVRHSFFDKYSTHGKHNGTGLGTYSARLAAEAHGGNIAMETSPESGTVVRVTLPRGQTAI